MPVVRTAVARYAAFLRLPDVARLLAMAVLARMPIGTVTLAMLLHVRALTGSFATAGAAVGTYLGASAATAPLVGRWIDRRGPRAALLVTGTASPAPLLVLWLAGPLALSPTTVLTVAGIAGAFAPPIAVLTRTMWRYRFDDDDGRKTAFAIDAVLVEFSFTAGPALIALLLAVGSPAIVFGAAFVFTALAVPTFIASPALHYWRHHPHAERHLLGPLAEPRLLAVLATTRRGFRRRTRHRARGDGDHAPGLVEHPCAIRDGGFHVVDDVHRHRHRRGQRTRWRAGRARGPIRGVCERGSRRRDGGRMRRRAARAEPSGSRVSAAKAAHPQVSLRDVPGFVAGARDPATHDRRIVVALKEHRS